MPSTSALLLSNTFNGKWACDHAGAHIFLPCLASRHLRFDFRAVPRVHFLELPRETDLI